MNKDAIPSTLRDHASELDKAEATIDLKDASVHFAGRVKMANHQQGGYQDWQRGRPLCAEPKLDELTRYR